MADTILQSDDYRSFLRHAVERGKRMNPLWSYASFARALGLKSAASIHKIVRGRRDPSPQLTTRLASYFHFTPVERAHFVGLVLEQRAGKRAAKPAVVAPIYPDARVLTEAEFKAVSGWWFYTIRQMARWPCFRADPSWIQARLRFPVRKVAIRRALGMMTELGILKVEKGLIFAGGERGSAALRAFHTQMIDHARDVLVTASRTERWVNGLTLSMRQDREPEARAVLEDFVRSFNARFAEPGGDRVQQLNLQFFTLATKEALP